MTRPGRELSLTRLFGLLLLVASVSLLAQANFEWNIPKPFPKPFVPADNAMNSANVELGRHLFYDTRISSNGKESCASCHRQELAFTDGRARAEGTTGEFHPRSSMSLANVGYSPLLTWSNPSLSSLEEQALIPIFGTEPVELGLKGQEPRFLADIARDAVYQKLFPQAFPSEPALYAMSIVAKSLAAFERTLISVNSPYDRYRYGGESHAISDAAKRGEVLFYSGERAACFQCHGGWNFNGAVRYAGSQAIRAEFHNTGLYNLPGELSYPATNTGLYEYTHKREDIGKFRTPTPRNIAVTAPYMHDGSVATLSDVIDHYAAGGRTITSGAYAGVGHDNPNKSGSVRGFKLTELEKKDVIAFLDSLTDAEFLHNPGLSNPWK
jgi:cytochrome c peroxidase